MSSAGIAQDSLLQPPVLYPEHWHSPGEAQKPCCGLVSISPPFPPTHNLSGISCQPWASVNQFLCQDQLPAAAWGGNKDARASSQPPRLASKPGQGVASRDGSRTFMTKPLVASHVVLLQSQASELGFHPVQHPGERNTTKHLLSICWHSTPNPVIFPVSPVCTIPHRTATV